MIALHRTEIEPPEPAEKSLLQTVKDFLRFTETPQSDMTYDTRLKLRRFHHEALRDAVARESGFTLVEMLVAVAIVLLMMSLFTTIFEMATKAMSVQKGMSENDQRVRMVETLLRSDLNAVPLNTTTGLAQQTRTFNLLIPFTAGEINLPINPVTKTATNANERRGYFYISENDPNDDTDDVLALTISLSPAAAERVYGHSGALLPDAAGNFGPGNPSSTTPPFWGNQPEFDDNFGAVNQASASQMAEVCYFIRNGNLYRRVMLIRTPGVVTLDDHTPLDDIGNPLSTLAYNVGGTRNFWTDFDFSAIFDSTLTPPAVTFHGAGDMTAANLKTTLLDPKNRWGFDNTSAAGTSLGIPREFAGTTFIGRFTQAETSDPNFGYPGRFKATTPNQTLNPMAQSTPLTVSDGTVTTYPNGTRVSEDLLLSNVLSFDIKVWDGAASLGADGVAGTATDPNRGAYGSDDGDFRDIGHAGAFGFFRAANAKNAYYGANRFDTWGPAIDNDGISGMDKPPYQPLWNGPDGKPGIAGQDDDGDGIIDNATELGWPGTDDFMPLSAIKITVRFYDVTSKQVRDITGVFSLEFRP